MKGCLIHVRIFLFLAGSPASQNSFYLHPFFSRGNHTLGQILRHFMKKVIEAVFHSTPGPCLMQFFGLGKSHINQILQQVNFHIVRISHEPRTGCKWIFIKYTLLFIHTRWIFEDFFKTSHYLNIALCEFVLCEDLVYGNRMHLAKPNWTLDNFILLGWLVETSSSYKGDQIY